MSRLEQNISRLLCRHPRTRPDGRIVTEMALLDQLAEAVRPSGSFKSSGQGSGAPASLAAIDRWRKLDAYARQVQIDRGRRARGSLGQIIASWGEPGSEEDRQFLVRATDWVIEQIIELVLPSVKRRQLWQPCPACGVNAVLNEDGEMESALTARDRDPDSGVVLPESEMDIACAQCGAFWKDQGDDHQLTWVLSVLASQRDGPGRHTDRSEENAQVVSGSGSMGSA